MFTRINQVISALTAKISNEDRIFVSNFLTMPEQSLFWGMNVPDQRHALNVAYTTQQLAQAHPAVDQTFMVKCALLHDVGKVKGDVSTADKIITVIGYNVSPSWAKKWGKLGRGNGLMNLRHAFYIYFHHAARSATMLAAIGVNVRIVEIIARHHEVPADHDPLELILLRIADNLH